MRGSLSELEDELALRWPLHSDVIPEEEDTEARLERLGRGELSAAADSGSPPSFLFPFSEAGSSFVDGDGRGAETIGTLPGEGAIIGRGLALDLGSEGSEAVATC